MLQSGLLSLSIHEALTFEGTEIAIHPDLFADPSAGWSVAGSASSSRHAVLTRQTPGGSGSAVSLASLATAAAAGGATAAVVQPTLEKQTSTSDSYSAQTAAAALTPSTHEHKDGTGFAAAAHYSNSHEPQLASVAESKSNASLSNNRRLEVGNMIEIKVWDPRSSPQPNSMSSNKLKRPTSSAQRMRLSAAPVAEPISAPTPTELLKGQGPSTTIKETEESASFLKDPPKPPTAVSPASSMQYSVDSPSTRPLDATIPPPPSPRGNRKRADSTEQDASTILTSSMPKSPRQESPGMNDKKGTASPNPRPGKPPLIQKKTSNTLPSAPNTESRQASAKLTKPAHFRDISDMTMDTTLVGAAFAHDVDLGIPSMDSHDCGPGEEDVLAKISSTHTLRVSIVMLVTEKTLTSLKGQARSQISMLRQIADLYELSPYDMVTVSRIEKSVEPAVLGSFSADFVAFTIKDQFISRGDMLSFQKSLIGRWIYEGERLSDSDQGIKAHAREIRHADNLAKSGIITEDTKITFRSRSARIIWLVQVSSEMWDYSSPYESNVDGKEEGICELVFDKFVRFMYKLFKKWKELEVTHSLTVVFFSRTLLGNQHGKGPVPDGRASQDIYGRLYEDHYKTVVDNEAPTDWDSLIVRIKREFVRYPCDVGWDLSSDNYRRPSTAMQGNLLEAINVTLNLLQFHFLDRDLHRTGNSIVVISPECGVFEVDKALAGITYQRMMDNGIGSDMVCLGLPPLHVAPFFLYNNVFDSDKDQAIGDKTYSEVPHWMHLSFVRYDGETADPSPGDSKRRMILPSLATESSLESLQIASNGFLVPQGSARAGNHVEASPLKSFAVLKSISISPGMSKSQSQQRQLISGRDFKDILEACRPRTSSYMLPSPLANLLRLQGRGNQPKGRVPVSSDIGGPIKIARQTSDISLGRRQLKEWGTVDFDDADGPMSFHGSGSRSASNRARSPVPVAEDGEQSQASCKSSPSSSTTPSYSFVLGKQVPSPSLCVGGLQIQRSPSLDLESEISGDVDAENLRKLMCEHDEKYSRQASNSVGISQMDPLVSSMRENDVASEVGSDHLATSFGSANEASGGLVAALRRYNVGDSVHGLRDHPMAKNMNSSGKAGSPTSGLGSLAVSYMAIAGMKVGSDPPGHIPPQVRQAFMRNQQQPTMSGSFDQRRSHLSRSIPLLSQAPSRNQQERQVSRSPNSLGRSPLHGTHLSAMKLASSTLLHKDPPRSRSRSSKHGAKNRKSVVNPFRQQDEDDELEKKSHNRRRWSHVFPLGELEFKRHTGPLWKSLCEPAILPLTIDYFPTPQELEDKEAYRFNPYQLTLQGMEQTHYASHRELLMEMVRQRITQDFQVVPHSVLSASNAVSQGDIQHTLSMGHRIHVLTYDSQSDTIDVKLYSATAEEDQPITYDYSMYSPYTKSYRRVVQTFEKYSKAYRWNWMDHVILEDIDIKLSVELRCRRLQFGLIPPKVADDASEQEYIEKFQRLLDYLGKLREKEEASTELVVKTLTRKGERPDLAKVLQTARLGTTEEMILFKIRLRKGKWVEVWIDSVFDTSRSYRIIFNWLVASTSKVEAQVQLVQRRCVQYGLELISFPQTCISRDLSLSPFDIPEFFCVRRAGKVEAIISWLLNEDFIDDGMHMTDASYLRAIEKSGDFRFPLNPRTKEIRSVAGRQFVHRAAGAVFARLIVDEQSWAILVVILNNKLIREDKGLQATTEPTVKRIQTFIESITASDEPTVEANC